jgi:glycosyltransferase involved in cell wall biosynthesis
VELDVLIPAYNEAGYVARTVAALRGIPEVRQIIVIDDGSTDGTALEAGRAGARVIRLARNQGKGAAVLFGARFTGAPYLALVDADLGDSAAEISRLFDPVREGSAAMAVARFPRLPRRGGMGMVKRLAAWSIRRCTGCHLQEPLSGQRVLRRELLAQLRFPPRGFGLEVALAMDCLKNGYPIREILTAMSHRERGRDPAAWLHRSRQCAAVLRELWLRRDALRLRWLS